MTESSKAQSEIIETLAGRGGWTKIEDLATATGQSGQALAEAIIELEAADVIITETDVLRRSSYQGAPVIGGEARYFMQLI